MGSWKNVFLGFLVLLLLTPVTITGLLIPPHPYTQLPTGDIASISVEFERTASVTIHIAANASRSLLLSDILFMAMLVIGVIAKLLDWFKKLDDLPYHPRWSDRLSLPAHFRARPNLELE